MPEERLGDLLAGTPGEQLILNVARQLGHDPADALARHRAGLDIVIDAVETNPQILPVVVEQPLLALGDAVLERHLARHGGWWVEGSPAECADQVETTWEAEDSIGRIVVTYGLGRLTVADLHLVAWLLAQWRPDEPSISFTARAVTRGMGLAWKGDRRAHILAQLRRIYRTSFVAEVWHPDRDSAGGRWVERHFGILAGLVATEQRTAKDAPNPRGSLMSVRLDPFLEESLADGQRVSIPWRRLAAIRTNDLARRLLWFLASHKGFVDHTGAAVYEVTIDEKLRNTLGSTRAQLRDFRRSLADAAQAVMTTDPRYVITIRAGAKRGAWVLSTRRTDRGGG